MKYILWFSMGLIMAAGTVIPMNAYAATTASVPFGGTGTSSFAYGLIGSPGGSVYLRNFATSSLGLLTSNVSEGSNLYYTLNRWATAMAGTTTDALAEGSNHLYYTLNRWATAMAGTTTDALHEGSNNFYWTQTRFNTAFGLKSTSDLAEGSRLYYTDQRVDDRIDASTTIPHIGGAAWGDHLQWDGSQWVVAATSTLGISGGAGANAGTAGQVGYYKNDGTVIDGTSTIFMTPIGNVGVGTTTPARQFVVAGNTSGGNVNFIRTAGASAGNAFGVVNVAAWTTDAAPLNHFGPQLSFYVGTTTSGAGGQFLGNMVAKIYAAGVNTPQVGELLIEPLLNGADSGAYLYMNANVAAVEIATTTGSVGTFNVQSVSSGVRPMQIYCFSGAHCVDFFDNAAVGIGTTSNTAALGVTGNGYFTNALGVGKRNSTASTVDLGTGGSYKILGSDVLTGTTLGSGITGSSLTSVGTLTGGTWNATTIAVANGGTGVTSETAHGVIIGEGTSGFAGTTAGNAGEALLSGGASADPSFGKYRAGTLQSFCTGIFTSANATDFMPGFGGIATTCAGLGTTRTSGMAVSSSTVKYLRVNCGTAFKNSSGGITTVVKNGSATALTCTVGATTGCSDTTHSFTTADGDILAVSMTTVTPSETGANCNVVMEQWLP